MKTVITMDLRNPLTRCKGSLRCQIKCMAEFNVYIGILQNQLKLWKLVSRLEINPELNKPVPTHDRVYYVFYLENQFNHLVEYVSVKLVTLSSKFCHLRCWAWNQPTVVLYDFKFLPEYSCMVRYRYVNLYLAIECFRVWMCLFAQMWVCYVQTARRCLSTPLIPVSGSLDQFLSSLLKGRVNLP